MTGIQARNYILAGSASSKIADSGTDDTYSDEDALSDSSSGFR